MDSKLTGMVVYAKGFILRTVKPSMSLFYIFLSGTAKSWMKDKQGNILLTSKFPF